MAVEASALDEGKPTMGLNHPIALRALAVGLEALAAPAWNNDPKAVRLLCSLLGLRGLLADYDVPDQQAEPVVADSGGRRFVRR